MEESILITIKKLLNIGEDDDSFDTDVITHINSVLADLTQLGVGPSEGFSIEDDSATWIDFLGELKNVENAKSYIHLRVKLIFDPPQSSAVIKSYETQVEKLEWRLNVAVD